MRESDYVTVTEGAKLIGRPAVTVRWWARNGKCLAYKSGGTWLIHRVQLCRRARVER